MYNARILLVALGLLGAATVSAQQNPAFTPVEGDYVIKDFRFASGESLPDLRLHYATFGRPERDARGVVKNAVLILHGTGGSGRQFLRDVFAGVLFGPGQLLDSARYYIILPDGIGHGRSSKPSDGLHARFPHYTYDDMVRAHYILMIMGSAPLEWQKEAPTRLAADSFVETYVRGRLPQTDANDMLYQFDASRFYNPAPNLERIVAPLLAINSADDQINPPELGIMEREIGRVKRGRYVLIAISDRTRGHGTHTLAALWKEELARLLRETEALRQ